VIGVPSRMGKAACLGVICLILAVLALPLRADSPGSVTVIAPRDQQKLKEDVDTFVSSAIVRPNGESLLRWNHPMCALAGELDREAGELDREAGELVLTRPSQIAGSGNAPLGSETCKPNFFVIVAKNPESFLRLWWRRNPRLFDTRHGIVPAKRFIETPRPVRVWYNAGFSGGEDGALFNGMLAESSAVSGAFRDYPVFASPSGLGSRITY
jgi:hypothetical protein